MRVRAARIPCLAAAILVVLPHLTCSTTGPVIKRTEDFELTFAFDGFERHAQVHVPTGYTGGTTMPLVVVLHGSGADGTIMRSMTGLDDLADERGFFVVYPDAVRNWAYPGSDAEQQGVDDVAFVDELLDRLENLLALDPDRVTITGFSSGGFMTQALACRLAGRLAAAAPVAGTLWHALATTCQPRSGISILMVHGTLDGSVPFDGDSASGRWSVDESMRFWAARNGCNDAPSVALVGRDTATGIALRREAYGGCDGRTEVRLDALEGVRHQWVLSPFSISELAVNFTLRQRR